MMTGEAYWFIVFAVGLAIVASGLETPRVRVLGGALFAAVGVAGMALKWSLP
jgi:hypothetical protein